MKYKPWPLIIIGVLHLLEPLFKIIFFSLYFNLTPIRMLALEIKHSSALHIFEYFFLFPIAGFAILKVKKWSVPLFLLVEVWVLLSNSSYFMKLWSSSQYGFLALLLSFALINIVVVLYLLLPAVRIAYFDPKIRWWEAKPRYQKEIDCLVKDHQCKILNISESGIFVCYPDQDFKEGEIVNLHFEDLDLSIETAGKVIHHFSINQKPGYGIQFVFKSRQEKSRLKKLIAVYERSNVPRRPERRSLWREIINGIRTGQGFVPSSRG